MNRFPRVITLLFALGLLAACGDGVTESQHLAKAMEYADQGELDAASIELKNALQQNPDNPLTRLELGKLYLKIGDMAAAEKELSKALALGVEDEKILPYLGRSLLNQGKFADVMALPLKNLKGEEKAEVLALKGLTQLVLGDQIKARFLVDKAMATGVESVQVMVANAGLLAFNKEFEKARKQLDALFKIDPEFAQAWSMLGDIELSGNRPEQALDAYTKAVSLRRNNMSDMLKRAMILIQLKQYDRAQKDITYLKDKIPLHPGFNHAQGVIHFHNKNLQDAQAAFDLALVDEKRYPMALYYAGLTSHLLGQRERAEKYATQFFTKSPQFPPARKLLALIQISNLKYTEAEEIMRPLVETNKDDAGAMNILASALLKQGKTDESIDLLSKVVALDPDSPNAQMRLGVGLMISGDDAAGEEHLSAAVKLDESNKKGEIVLILNYLRQKQFDRALEAAKAYKERFPEEATSYNVMGRVYLLTGKKQEARETFQMALEIEPGDPSASQNLAALAINDKDFDKARSYYLGVLKKHNNHLAILLRLAALDSLERKEKSMVKYLQQAIEAHPRAVEPRLVLARYYLSKGKNEQVAILVGEFDQVQMKTPSVLELVSMAQLAKGDFSGARGTLKHYIKLNPNSAVAHHRLAQAYAGMNKFKEMKAELERSVQLAPEYLPARIALAQVFLRSREKDHFVEQLEVMKKLAPKDPEIIKLEAALALLEGNKNKAIKLAEAAYNTAPTTRNLLTLSRIRWNTDDRNGAVQLYNEWLTQYPDDIQVRLALAGSHIILEQTDAAIEQYRKILDSDGDNLIALNNLSWYLRDAEPTKALDYAKYANDLVPNRPELMDTLAMALMKNNQVDRAQRIIKDAMIRAPGNPAIQYHGAMIFTASGNDIEAIRVLDKLVSSGAKYSEQKEAEALLKKLQAKQ